MSDGNRWGRMLSWQVEYHAFDGFNDHRSNVLTSADYRLMTVIVSMSMTTAISPFDAAKNELELEVPN